jgi:hypothetical protein
MCIRRETREKARRSLAFPPVSKSHTHIYKMYYYLFIYLFIYVFIYLYVCTIELKLWPITANNLVYYLFLF